MCSECLFFAILSPSPDSPRSGRYGLSLRNTFVLSGLSSIATGLMFDIPMAVQPMKSIAAVALTAEAGEFSIESMLAAGIITATFVMLLGVTGLIDAFNRIIPLPVVRGLQLGLGVLLVKKAAQLLSAEDEWAARLLGWDGYLLALACLLYSLLFYNTRRVPVALVLFGLGLVVAIVRSSDGGDAGAEVLRVNSTARECESGGDGEQDFGIHFPSAEDWGTGFVHMAIPQIPLTTLNSVIAVCKLSEDLFPHTDEQHKATPRRVATSVGLMNIATCFFGGFPMCHGAGGLAGQYRFGGRTGASVELLGLVKIVLGLAFGQKCLTLLTSCVFPYAVLGVMLAISVSETTGFGRFVWHLCCKNAGFIDRVWSLRCPPRIWMETIGKVACFSLPQPAAPSPSPRRLPACFLVLSHCLCRCPIAFDGSGFAGGLSYGALSLSNMLERRCLKRRGRQTQTRMETETCIDPQAV